MKRILLLLVVLGLAAGYWFMENRERFAPKPEAVQIAPQRWQVSTTQPSPDINATQPQENATVAETNATLELNATATVPPADEIVGHEFVRDAAEYLVAHYTPGGTKKNPAAQGRFDLSVKSVNIRYGVDFPGMKVDPADTLGARKTVFSHVLQAPVLEFLQTVYTPLFLDSLEQALASASYVLPSGQSAAVTAAQRSEMMTLLAARLKAVGLTTASLARTASIRPLVVKYLEDMDKVSQAHQAFWTLQTANASPSAISEASTRIKTTIQTREISRQRLLQAIVSTSSPQGMDASELVYLAQWVYRRGVDDAKAAETVGKAADLLVKVAEAVTERAQQPAPGTVSTEGEAGNASIKVGE